MQIAAGLTASMLVCSQLLDDGLSGAAHAVAAATMLEADQAEAPHCLAKMVASGSTNANANAPGIVYPPIAADCAAGASAAAQDIPPAPSGHLNLDTKFITTHKNACRVAAFSPDGSYVRLGRWPFMLLSSRCTRLLRAPRILR